MQLPSVSFSRVGSVVYDPLQTHSNSYSIYMGIRKTLVNEPISSNIVDKDKD